MDGKLQRVYASEDSRLESWLAHQGLLRDSEVASYLNRARQYLPWNCIFAQRDPQQLPREGRASQMLDGVHSYGAYKSNPLVRQDWSGEASCSVNGNLATVEKHCNRQCRDASTGFTSYEVAEVIHQVKSLMGKANCDTLDCPGDCEPFFGCGAQTGPAVVITGEGCTSGVQLCGNCKNCIVGCCECPCDGVQPPKCKPGMCPP
jgi:hypothetical protein